MEEVGTVDSPLTKCAGCDSVIDNDGDGGRWSEISGAEFCWGCFESDMEHASTITYFRNGEKPAAVKISSNWIVDGEYYEDLKSEDTAGINREWVRTDGWRGHAVTTLGDEWFEAADGLFLWGEQTEIVNLGGELQEMHKEGVLPFEVALVADLTSNVFAAGCSIWLRKSDEELWHAFYQEYAGTAPAKTHPLGGMSVKVKEEAK
ncbi:hypothetical protein UFOVP570_22 [uncultured Caudovirales phage]|uniref:Uncharacterized protein n=1 Tax=uncultured Caudovirales phage TaxID=2100421 RepID=A0A6J5MZ82_9CAUD|nr:hypothetical protein UFOVP570_22 [uncultured Caudovirales phage]